MGIERFQGPSATVGLGGRVSNWLGALAEEDASSGDSGRCFPETLAAFETVPRAVSVSSNYKPLEHYSWLDRQIVLCLMGRTESPYSFDSEDYKCRSCLDYFEATSFGYGLHLHYLYLGMVHWLHGRNEGTVELLELAERHKDHIPLLMPWPDHFFYTPLVLAPHHEGPHREHVRQTFEAHLAQLRHWQEKNHENFDHRVALVEAEWARLNGRFEEALDGYERAIVAAQDNGFTQHEAMANELSARLHLELGRSRAAMGYLLEAHLQYGRWGAQRKVELLEREFPRVLGRRNTPRGGWNQVSTSTTVELDQLDLVTVMKVSQAISGELNMGRLLERLLGLCMENAGATRAALILHRDGQFRMEGVARVGGAIERPDLPLHEFDDLPMGPLQFSARTQESVLIDSVERSAQYGKDPYLARARVQSVLCVPALRRGQVIAVLALEHHATAYAFTRAHQDLLELLSGQVAVALENATLYDTLEQKVAVRTEELQVQAMALRNQNEALQRTQSQLVQAEKMASLGQLVAGVAHEINNPINFVSSGLPTLRRDIDKVLVKVPEAARDSQFLKVSARIGRLLDAIEEGANRTASVVKDLRIFSRHDEASLKSGNLEEALDATLTLQRHRMLKVTLVRDFAGLPEVDCFLSQLNQVFMNLLSNAIEAMDGEGTLTVTTREVGDEVQLSVGDTGCGMDETTRSKVFDHFFTTKPVGSGVGLGLSISHKIVLQHRGRIEVDSTPGQGTTFRVCIPKRRREADSLDA